MADKKIEDLTEVELWQAKASLLEQLMMVQGQLQAVIAQLEKQPTPEE